MSQDTESWTQKIRWLRLLQVIVDAALISLAIVSSFMIRFDANLDPIYLRQLLFLLPIFLGLRLTVNAICGVYKRLWRYTGLTEVVELALATFTVTTIIMVARAAGSLSFDGLQLSYGIILIEPVFSFLFMMSARVARRMQTEHSQRRHWRQPVLRRALIVGAGDAGQMVAKELSQRRDVGVEIVGFIDDDPQKAGTRIGRCTVFGSTAQLAQVAENLFVDQVIIAIPSAPPTEIRRIVELCRKCEVQTLILPGLYELIGGRVSVNQLREVSLADLLGREPVDLDTSSIASYIEGKTVLITGAGGSIGSELCRQIMRFQPDKLILLGKGENSIFMIFEELKQRPEPVKLIPVIADIRNQNRLIHIFKKYKPEVVFHAAAHKHVPLMETNVVEAITNNIGGTQNLANLAVESGVETFVLVSSDKAVHPTSVMGATKRIAELVIQDLAQHHPKCKFVAVRFGNVLDSRGSVLPIWRQQIAAGGPVTVTHPDATRYFMLIPEAVQLIMQAGALGSGGEIFVLDMGKPIKILDLAHDLVKLSGLSPGEDIEIQFVGLRPGEKLYEELLTAEEGLTKTSYKKIWVGQPQDIQNLRLAQSLKPLFDAVIKEDEVIIRNGLNALVDGQINENPSALINPE